MQYCGARTPGGGSSSRWHSHYTICDSCYQQRNKGFSCPICQKAYRAAAYKEMVKCNFCHKFVHSTCDEEADLAAYHKKKENNPDYDYVCPSCKTNPSIESHLCAGGDSSLGESQTSEIPNIKVAEIDPLDGKPSNEMSSEEVQKQQNNRKKVCLGNARGKGAKFMLHRMGVMSQLGKKRSTRGKGRQLVLSNNSSDRYSNRTMDSDFTSDKKMLLCSARDKFILTQDICVMCGSLGIESDAHLITCAQCGQCYHPYCAGVKPSKGMLQKGWRCLDCTVCEGCGKKNDEARLLLCDECDISYHIYCVNPPLDTVPHGNWKCSYCTICQKCGRNLSQKGECTDANTAECPSCISQSFCAVCGKAYNNGDTIIQCEQCQHWSHFSCDSANIHLTINYYEENEYKCMKCRCLGKSQLPSMEEKSRNEEPSASQKQLTLPAQEGKNSSGNDRHDLLANNLIESAEAIHWIDGVCLSENGLNMIKSLSTEIKRKRKVRQAVGNANRDPLLDSTLPDEAPCDKYKDGMIWDGTETVLPEGFTISTNEEGVNILRKKRQRNLQKLGIGGFSVRNRTLKRDNDEAADQLNPVLAMDKKKKTIRKKQKNKLIEAYPAYLQEAFFGKPLLEGADVMTYESDSSDGIDATMKTYFTRFEEKKPEEDAAHASKEPAKFLKKARAEKDIPENKNMFSDQLPTVSQQKGNNGIGPTMFDAISSETPHIGSATNRNVLDNLASNKFLDGTNPTSNFMVNDNIDKALGEQTVVMMDNFNMPPQMPQEAKFAHSQLFVSDATMAANSSQLHYQQDQVNMQHKLSPQVVSTHVNMHNEKKNDEDNRVVEPVPEAMNVGTQKTAEKMRKDEDLGLMATISAVLYANTEHANLKEMYPNWNDRCKQILKKWRSLCNEKKAPFLQKAKDNRSALRQRREQNKISLPPKPQKQEDVGNAWKQHQIKIKEEQSNMFVNYGGIPYDPACYSGPAATHPTSHVGASVGEKFVVQSSVQRTTINAARASPLKITTTENIVESNQAYGSAEIGDKKLRNLLQKPNTEPMLLGPNSELFMSNDVLRLGLISNPSLNQNNPMLSTSGAPQPSELRQNIPELEQDVKIQPDLKITESQEGISASVELENVGFGDILGGLGEGDDDDLLKSLTSEIGDDFNILEYGDPELDVNVLNTLDFEENEKSSA
ncbi:histone-lysine N-methyltransferase 2C isoform X2 [Scaptodrosophila lebanonensis]|uniref:Histone-lysine N-methyltransferase 2C isoform X2 n=1 Tax=Drosophila lebanonensis TaxID=7225 RepID=A0A6J2UF69_DROLE|nr:histone-lysine N-methyltransferase 2C isoform X2 [Scaptodrosophila lebanonensis]